MILIASELYCYFQPLGGYYRSSLKSLCSWESVARNILHLMLYKYLDKVKGFNQLHGSRVALPTCNFHIIYGLSFHGDLRVNQVWSQMVLKEKGIYNAKYILLS